MTGEVVMGKVVSLLDRRKALAGLGPEPLAEGQCIAWRCYACDGFAFELRLGGEIVCACGQRQTLRHFDPAQTS